ncbi:MAG: aldo/keto reductase [Armatimonadetes bacterium]|nr:aldo/keto reductase [Armatimonadota bacterium]
MNQRTLGTTGLPTSALGFGCMRLPVLDGAVDEPSAIAMLRWAFDHGVDYADSAYGYHDGHSERVLGLALRDGYRERVTVATKMPVWLAKEPADFDRLFAEQCARLGTERIDCYLLHNLQSARWDQVRDLGVTDWLERRRAAGDIGAFGFSFHDSYATFERILDEYAGWQFCQLQYNYVCEQVQAGTRGLELAAARGLGVVVMEPLFGGTLATPPAPMQAVFDAAGADPTDLALRWLWAKPEVSLVLSGMSAQAQAEHNVALAARPGYDQLTAAESAVLQAARTAFEGLYALACTNCGYCLPCPQGLDIPSLFALFNSAGALGGGPRQLARALYGQKAEGERASACAACGECESKCPQHLPISEWMPKVQELLG